MPALSKVPRAWEMNQKAVMTFLCVFDVCVMGEGQAGSNIV